MAINYSVAVRNARLDAIETAIGTAPLLRIFNGAKPTAAADAATGTLLVEISLPSDWLSAASGGVKSKAGTWSAIAAATGTAGYFRILDTAGTACGIQGTVTATGGGGDMTIDSAAIALGGTVTVSTFAFTGGNG